MADYTNKLNLIRQYLEDYADERKRNRNWDIIDLLFHVTEGHKHDGVDSPLIDLDSLWRAIFELRAITSQLRVDLTSLDIRDWQQYLEYLRHKHYALDAPPSIETHYADVFNTLNKADQRYTDVAISPQQGILHLPSGYQGNQPYYYISKVFDLAHTLEELTKKGMADRYNPDVQPQQARARIFMARKGIVTPYIAIADELIGSTANPRTYAGARIGVQQEVSYVDDFIISKFDFKNKRKEDMTVPHIAWHHIDKDRPVMSRYRYGFGRKQKRWDDRIEFDTGQYEVITRADGDFVTTSPRYQDSDPIYKGVPGNQDDPRVLYHSDKALAWKKGTKQFYWYHANSNVFRQIAGEDIRPLQEENLVKVAARLDRQDGWVWIYKSWNVRHPRKQGFFTQKHQLIKWDGFSNFIEGPETNERTGWRLGAVSASGDFPAKHWPATTLAPDELEVDGQNVYPITKLGFNDDLAPEGESAVNYYNDNGEGEAHDSYQWFPFSSVYNDSHRGGATVNYVKFNPGILGTVHSISQAGDWVAEGPAKIIGGAYPATENPWTTSTDEQINDFEGSNDSVYLGSNGDDLFFYQAFVPYNGADIHRNERYKDEDFREQHPDYAWHGIIAHNIGTGQRRMVRGDMPFRVNIGGGVEPEGGFALITGGAELIKQFITPDFRILATQDNQPPENETIIYSYWVDRHLPGVTVFDRLSVRDDIVNPIRVDLNTGTTERITTHAEDATLTTAAARVHSPQVVMHSDGFSSLGGKNVRNRESNRLRRIDGKVRKIAKWTGALVTGSKARQLFHFEIGEDITDRDIVKVHVRARAEGKPAANPLDTAPRMRDIDLLDWRHPDWGILGRYANEDGHATFLVKEPDRLADRKLILMIENQRTTDRRAKIASRLHVDYVYVTVERQGYVYEYSWPDLPDGKQGAVILECQTGTMQRFNPGQEVNIGPRRDITGVEVDAVDVSIISNPEG